MKEVVISQDKMLQRLNKAPKSSTKFGMDELLAQSYQQAKEFIGKQQNMSFIELEYGAVLKNSKDTVQALIEFLELDLDAELMLKKIDRKLHRNQ